MGEDDGGNMRQDDGIVAITCQKHGDSPGSNAKLTEDEDDDEPNIGGCRDHHASEFDISDSFSPGWSFYSAISIFMTLTVLESINSTSTSSALVKLSEKMESTTTQLEWIGNSYMLASAVLQLPIACFSDVWGRKPFVIVSFFLFLAGSAICGAAPNIAALLTGRTIAGIGGAGTLVLSEVCITDLVPLRQRAKYYALLNVMWSIGSGLGPIIGGGLSQLDGNAWRWMFFINVPVAAIALAATPFALQIKPPEKGNHLNKLKVIDWVGIFLILSSSTSFFLSLTLGGVTFPWKSWHTLVPLILGLVGMIGTCCYEYFGAEKPMITVNVLFVNWSAGIGFFQALVQGFIIEALPYYLPLYYEGVLEYSPVISGLALLPLPIVELPCSLVAGFSISLFGRYKLASFIGWAMTTLGLGLLLLPSATNTAVGVWLGPLFPIAIGLGTLYAVLSTTVQASQPSNKWADAAAMMSFVRSVGEAMGVAVGGSIFASSMASGAAGLPLPPRLDPSESVDIIPFLLGLQPDDPLKLSLKKDLAHSMHMVYYLYIAFSGTCLLFNLFIKEYSLDKAYKSKHVLASGSSSEDDWSLNSTSSQSIQQHTFLKRAYSHSV